MKLRLLVFAFFLLSSGAYAQIEIPRTTDTGDLLKAEPEEKEAEEGLPEIEVRKPEKEEEEENDFLRKEPEKLDFRETNDDLLTAGSLIERKWKKDSEAKAIYKNDQYLGDFKTAGKFVEVYCRDHEYVDGDKVRVLLNGEVILHSVSLGAGYTPILVNLEDGYNNIEFEALNQGESGPNTAELKVFDEKGQPVTVNRWNLLTGAKASIVIRKERSWEENK
ncbi:hypothetical protein [Salegentibacter chungangensis]|uniref:Secreted protein n=1 Tax=Salegentibacter chungangensis TaxID=1335724 RepID=A0ABW3NTA1_9FLAO